jgi:predicted  nucleic acid-binding Zn-ribbon protein
MLWALLAIVIGLLAIFAEVVRDLQPKMSALRREQDRRHQELDQCLQEQEGVRQAIAAAQERVSSVEKERRVIELELQAQRQLLAHYTIKEQRRRPTRYKVAADQAIDGSPRKG